MFELPTIENAEEVVVNEEVILNDAEPLFIYGKKTSKNIEKRGA